MADDNWTCIFIDRIENDGRIVLTNPQEFGRMYPEYRKERAKERRSINRDMPPEGKSNENKLVKLIAYATYFNRNGLKNTEGLVLRGSKRVNTAIVAKDSDSVDPHIRNIDPQKNTTDWIAYISPDEKFREIKGKYLGQRFSENLERKIRKSIEYLENKH